MRLLILGATGRLGRALTDALDAAPDGAHVTWHGAGSRDVDVADPAQVTAWLERHRPDAILNAAGYTDVAAAERDRAACWRTNVEGVRHVADAAAEAGARLIHVSTDYVFWGGADRPDGGYREEDPPGPVRNYYALTKLVGEEAARRAPEALILRTSFRESAWPHPVAFDDLHTGQDYVDVIAGEFVRMLLHLGEVPPGILHIVTERKSAYDLAVRRNPGVRRGSKGDAPVDLPDDVSLNVDRWRALKERWR